MGENVFIHWTISMVPVLLGVLLSSNLHSQDLEPFSTVEQAVADPVVVELLGQEALDQLVATQRSRASAGQNSQSLAEGHQIASELSETVASMLDNFVSHRWEEDFDAKTFLLTARKMKVLMDNSTVPTVRQYINGRFQRIRYRMNLETVQYGLNWNIKQLGSEPTGKAVLARLVDKDFLVVPLAFADLLEPEVLNNYRESHQLLLRTCDVSAGGELGSGEAFAAMSRAAEEEAQSWYAEKQEIFEATQLSNSLTQQQTFFRESLQVSLYNQGKKALTRTVSQAKSALNDVNTGLKYAEINSQKALESAKKSDAAATQSAVQSGREHALEVAVATRRLGELSLQAAVLKKYMCLEAAERTQIPDVSKFTLAQLKERLQNHPRGGNANTTARNTLQELISMTERVEQVKVWAAEANSNCRKIDETMIAGEQAFASLVGENRTVAVSPFDVSSREAFDASKEKLATVIPTEDYVAFSQAWVKLLQVAIKEDPMVMADEEKYLAFLKENFQGKTVADIIGK